MTIPSSTELWHKRQIEGSGSEVIEVDKVAVPVGFMFSALNEELQRVVTEVGRLAMHSSQA